MREGVNKVALRLFEHNEKAYHAAVRMMNQYGKAAIVYPTGTGKSYIAFKLVEDNPDKVVIWLSPSEYIFKTQLESLKKNDSDFPLTNVHFYTYAKLMCCTQAQLDEIAAQKPAYLILDEFHRAGAKCWGESTVALLKLCPNTKRLGLIATNIRYLDNNRDMAEELFDGYIASDMNLGEAVVRGILPTPKYVTKVCQYQKALAKYQARVDNLRAPGIQDVNQKYLDALRRALEQADGLDRVFAHHITNKSGKYIVFCANKEHMDEMVSHVPEWFAGVNPDGYPLGQWIIKIRQQKLNGHLKEERIAQLDEIGMVWNIFDAKWEKAYALAAAYYEENGNLNIPRSYVTAAGERLGQWVASQQWAYPKGKLTDEQVERLNRIGMYWGNRNDRQWNEGYQEAKRYFDAHGDLNVPVDYVSPGGYNLGNWVKRQRYTRHNPEKSCAVLTEERIAKLDEIGMRWEKADSRPRRLELAQGPHRESEKLNVSANHKTGEDIGLCS